MSDIPKKEKAPKKEKFKFKAVLMIADKPTEFNRIYSRELCEQVVARLNEKPSIIVQDSSPKERSIKDIPADVVWKQKIMANVISARLIDNRVMFEAECRITRDGKILSGMVQSLGLQEIEFTPVGRGRPDENGVVGLDYELIYISVDPIHK